MGMLITHILEMRSAYKILDRKPEGKIPLRRRRHRCEGFIKKYLGEISRAICGLDLSGLE
jgi:hypothetical protein